MPVQRTDHASEPLPTVPARRDRVVVVVLLVLAAAVRLAGLGAESLWFDEVESLRLSDGGLAEVLRDPAESVHPPLYFLVLAGWRHLAGSDPFVLRLPGVAASLGGLWALYLLAQDLAGRRTARVALLLGAVNPLDVYYAQEARMYAQAAALATLAAWLLWRWLERPASRGRLAVPYALAAAALVYTHYLGAVLLVSQGLFALAVFLARRRWRDALAYAACGAAVAVAFAPWMVWVRHLRDTLYSDAQMRWMPVPSATDALGMFGREAVWGLVWPAAGQWWTVGLVLPLGAAAVLAWQTWRPTADPRPLAVAWPVWLAAAPVGVAVLLSHAWQPVLYPERFAMLVLAPFLLLVAVAWTGVRPRLPRLVLVATTVAAMAAITVVQGLTAQKPDWRGLAREWPTDRRPALVVCFPAHLVYCLSPYLDEPQTATPPAAALAEARQLHGGELWVVASASYPFDLMPGEAAAWHALVALGPSRTRWLAGTYRLDVVQLGGSSGSTPQPEPG